MIQKGKTREKADDAVSEVIGELMMLVITVMIFVILIAAVSTIISKPRTEIVHMDALAQNDTVLAIRHAGGDTVAYGQLAVVINGHLIPARADDPNGNDRWDLGENLVVSGVDTTHSLSVLVYDSITNNVLGDFTVDTLPAGLPVALPSATPAVTPTVSPTVTPTVTPTATPTPQLHHFTITATNPWTNSGGTLTVTAYDQNNNIFTGYRGSVYFSSDDSQDDFQYYNNGHSYTFTAADSGVHVFGNTELDRDSHTHRITVRQHQGPSGYVDVFY
ncbi:type IV pilin N-terminal domain-containing protein [Methanocella sp. MCL-LM]|uniref:type IV pilin N-terminal domain-containing protein n=1 Tax=Methanocella sp. MCL-LM TaxID=3412035 RepID=UPI003C73079C